jgi:hypothetical protein
MPCGHVFCKYCLTKWKLQCRNRQYDCPNCRQKVGRDKVTPNIYLENLISSWMGELGPDTLAERKKAIAFREGRKYLIKILKMVHLRMQPRFQNKRPNSRQTRRKNWRGTRTEVDGEDVAPQGRLPPAA